MTPTHPISKLYRTLGYLALLPAAYALGVFLLLSMLIVDHPSTQRASWISMAYILLCAHSCYLLDRVKITDHRQDPADALALPDRAMIFSQFARPIRRLVFFELFASSIVGWFIDPIIASLPLLSLIGIHLYAGRSATPSTPRLKDLTAIKAFIIASGHLALPIAVLWAQQHDLILNLTLDQLLAIVGVWMIVSGDAMLCDVDDHDADRAYSTKSLAVLLGSNRAWMIAMGFITLGSIMISLDSQIMIGIGSALVLSTLATYKNTNHRDLVDARLLPIVLIGIWIAWWITA